MRARRDANPLQWRTPSLPIQSGPRKRMTTRRKLHAPVRCRSVESSPARAAATASRAQKPCSGTLRADRARWLCPAVRFCGLRAPTTPPFAWRPPNRRAPSITQTFIPSGARLMRAARRGANPLQWRTPSLPIRSPPTKAHDHAPETARARPRPPPQSSPARATASTSPLRKPCSGALLAHHAPSQGTMVVAGGPPRLPARELCRTGPVYAAVP
jgi:hypothetical protein